METGVFPSQEGCRVSGGVGCLPPKRLRWTPRPMWKSRNPPRPSGPPLPRGDQTHPPHPNLKRPISPLPPPLLGGVLRSSGVGCLPPKRRRPPTRAPDRQPGRTLTRPQRLQPKRRHRGQTHPGLRPPLPGGEKTLRTSATPAAAVEAEPVITRAWAQDDFGRLVFDWPRAVAYETRIEDDTLTVVFATPLRTTFWQVERHLNAYIAGVDLSPDGRRVTATLNGAYALRAFTLSGEDGLTRVVVDLLADGGAAPSTGLRTGLNLAQAPTTLSPEPAASPESEQPPPEGEGPPFFPSPSGRGGRSGTRSG